MAEWVTKKDCTKHLRKGRRGRKGVCMQKKEGLRGYYLVGTNSVYFRNESHLIHIMTMSVLYYAINKGK